MYGILHPYTGGAMAGITISNEKGCPRLYCTFSFRDKNNKPQRVRKSIGKIDSRTGKAVFNNYFKRLLYKQNISINDVNNIPYHDIPKVVDFGTCSKDDLINKTYHDKIDSIQSFNNNEVNGNNLSSHNGVNSDYINKNDQFITLNIDNNSIAVETFGGRTYISHEKQFSVKKIGQKYILDMVIGDTGIQPILQNIFPSIWDKIITLAYYLINDQSAVMYCQDWIEENETLLSKDSMQSQRISELFLEISNDQIMQFWNSWAALRNENEYLALDITSISSYSNLISELEFGHNRDEERLPQLNLCMLFGEKSALPVFSSFYTGSLNDVTILRNFLDKLSFFGDYKYNFVMDKGFYSLQNIKYLLKFHSNNKFMIAVPFTTSIARDIVKNYKDKLEESLSFIHNNDTIMGFSFLNNINNHDQVVYHVTYNEYKYNDAKKCLKDKAIRLRNEALQNPTKYINEKEHKKYLIFKKLDDQTYDISINLDRINYEIKNVGWLIIVSNDLNTTYRDALGIYRSKDIVEKAFNNLKNSLSFKRLHVHNSKTLNGKLFIAFISLILSSYIHNIMHKSGLDNSYTITGLLNKLDSVKIERYKGQTAFSPLTKEVKRIFNAFGIKITTNN
jgi:transposase